MKRIYLYFILMACFLGVTGCQKDSNRIVSLELENYEGVNKKVYIDKGENISYACWNNGDKININDYTYKISINSNTNTAYVWTDSRQYIRNTIWARYPISSHSSHHFDMINREPFFYTYVLANTPNGEIKQKIFAPMFGKTSTSSNSLAVRNVGALMEVNLKNNTGGDIKLIAIELVANTPNQYLRGAIDVLLNSTENIPKYKLYEKSNIVSMLFNHPNAEVNLASNSIGTYYIPILPVNSAFTVNVVYLDKGTKLCKKFTKEGTAINSIPRNALVEMDLNMDNSADEYQWEGTGNSVSDPYKIYTLLDLEVLAEKCKAGNNFNEKYFTQMHYINMAYPFKGIGTRDTPFCGKYKGAGLGMEGGYLFNYLGSGASVEDVQINKSGMLSKVVNGDVVINNIELSGIKINSSESIYGGICSKIEGGNVIISNSGGAVDLHIEESGTYTIGSICGENNSANTKIINCSSSVFVIFDSRNITLTGCIMGCLVGKSTEKIEIEKSSCFDYRFNYYDEVYIIVNGSSVFGGIIGSSSGDVVIKNSGFCSFLTVPEFSIIGGLVGDGTNVLIENSFVKCNLRSVNNSGGVVGKLRNNLIFENGYISDFNEEYGSGYPRYTYVGSSDSDGASVKCKHIFIAENYNTLGLYPRGVNPLPGHESPQFWSKDEFYRMELVNHLNNYSNFKSDWCRWASIFRGGFDIVGLECL